jgi:hypothetical protein
MAEGLMNPGSWVSERAQYIAALVRRGYVVMDVIARGA